MGDGGMGLVGGARSSGADLRIEKVERVGRSREESAGEAAKVKGARMGELE